MSNPASNRHLRLSTMITVELSAKNALLFRGSLKAIMPPVYPCRRFVTEVKLTTSSCLIMTIWTEFEKVCTDPLSRAVRRASGLEFQWFSVKDRVEVNNSTSAHSTSAAGEQ